MRIATWNIERLKHKRDIDSILLACSRCNADILVLTETNRHVQPQYRYCFHTPYLENIQPGFYQPSENRVSIFTNYPCVRQHPTYDKNTSLCVELETEQGNLLVYGTIIGVYGNRNPQFTDDLKHQCADFERLSTRGKNLCICGDFNLSFADNYYYTEWGRRTILQSFSEHHIRLLTSNQPECIDHIALSNDFVTDAEIQIAEWNEDKRLSDHKGIVADISWSAGGLHHTHSKPERSR